MNLSYMRKIVAALATGLVLSAAQASGPIKSTTAAKELAQSWLKATSIVGLQVGPAKNLALVYFVDLLESDDPSLHTNHLVIRKEDGFASLIYPAHDAPKLSHEQRLGLDGLAGMSGMSGMSGSTQRKTSKGGSLAVATDVDARRGVEAWLWMNGFQDEYKLEDVTSMNNVFVVDLYEKKQHRLVNQAILRGVDGYVTLVRPVKTKVLHFPKAMMTPAPNAGAAK
jgi:hypothetical protein